MPASTDDLDDLDDDGGDSSGKGLRAQLEAALKRNRNLEAKVRKTELSELLTTKGFDLVKADDLAGVEDSELETRAKKIQDERIELQAELLRKALGSTGLEGDDLEALVTQTIASRKPEVADTVGRVKNLSGVPGTPASLIDSDQLHGRSAIEFGLANPTK